MARLQKVVELRPDLIVTVLELRPIDLRAFLSYTGKVSGADLQELILSDWENILHHIGGIIRADVGNLTDISFSEILQLIDVVLEVNQSFFALMGTLGAKQETPKTPSQT